MAHPCSQPIVEGPGASEPWPLEPQDSWRGMICAIRIFEFHEDDALRVRRLKTVCLRWGAKELRAFTLQARSMGILDASKFEAAQKEHDARIEEDKEKIKEGLSPSQEMTLGARQSFFSFFWVAHWLWDFIDQQTEKQKLEACMPQMAAGARPNHLMVADCIVRTPEETKDVEERLVQAMEQCQRALQNLVPGAKMGLALDEKPGPWLSRRKAGLVSETGEDDNSRAFFAFWAQNKSLAEEAQLDGTVRSSKKEPSVPRRV